MIIFYNPLLKVDYRRRIVGEKGAKRGFKRETIFVELINNNANFRKDLEKTINQFNLTNGKIMFAEDVKSTCKSDVNIQIKENNGQTIELGCSLKSAEANFNQLDRRWLSDWEKVLDMPENTKDMIQSSLDRKIYNSRDVFILPSQEPTILRFLEQKKEILFRELFTKEDENLKIFVSYDENNRKWYVARIEDIIEYLKSELFTRTNRGIVKIGDSLSLQRKGGDGNYTKVPKDSPSHPSNQIQFKIKPLTIISMVPTVEISE